MVAAGIPSDDSEGVVLGEDVAFDPDRPLLAQAGNAHAREALAEVDRVRRMTVRMAGWPWRWWRRLSRWESG